VGSPTSATPDPIASRRGTHRLLFAAVAVGLLVLDQVSKIWAVDALDRGEIIDVVWTLRFKLAYNSGASFSMGEGWGRWIAVVAVLIVGLLVWQGLQVRSRLSALALGMIVGGALGNVLDRAFRAGGDGFLGGSVVDFIDFQWWPVFNVADMGVVVGAILLVVASFLPVPDDDPSEPVDVGEGAGTDRDAAIPSPDAATPDVATPDAATPDRTDRD
jgi:signal peptidase II